MSRNSAMTNRRKTILAIVTIACAATATLAQQRGDRGDRGGSRRSEPREGATPATAPASTRPGASTLPADYYNVVTDKNIFLRERRKPVIQTSRPVTSRPVLPPEATIVLRGVVLEEGLFRAYFENTTENALIRVAAGDPLARGHVVEISIDAVAFESANGLVWVKVGDNLIGSRVASASPSVSTGGSSSSQPTATPGNLMSIEERMRQRRGGTGGGGGGARP